MPKQNSHIHNMSLSFRKKKNKTFSMAIRQALDLYVVFQCCWWNHLFSFVCSVCFFSDFRDWPLRNPDLASIFWAQTDLRSHLAMRLSLHVLHLNLLYVITTVFFMCVYMFWIKSSDYNLEMYRRKIYSVYMYVCLNGLTILVLLI